MSLDFPWKTRRQFHPRCCWIILKEKLSSNFLFFFKDPLIECEIGDRLNILDLTLYSERGIINIHILIRLLIVDCNVYINICSVVREKKRRATEQTRFLN